MVYQLEKQMKELGDKVPADVKGQLDTKLASLKDAIKREDYDAMKSGMQELQDLAMKMGEAVYKQQGAAGQGQPGAGPQGGETSGKKKDDGVVDAEVVD